MLSHVELDRTFLPLGDEEEYDSEVLKAHATFGMKSAGWPELLKMSLVVILAEAGTGKSHEFLATARRLRVEGKSAFFCRIEDLAAIGLTNVTFAVGDVAEFQDWLTGDNPAWFFLDSVDEAQLVSTRYYEWALRKFRVAIERGMTRAHVFISSRVSDWRATADLALLTEVLPLVVNKASTASLGEVETPDVFDPVEQREEKAEEKGAVGVIPVMQLAPLNAEQMRRFVAAQGVHDVGAFMDAIERSDAEIFAERPQDLLELISYWTRHGAIGTHSEMIAFNIEKKLLESNQDRAERRPLAKEKAIEGAEVLAAALTLTRKNSIILPDQPVDPVRAAYAIDAQDILPEWNARDIQSLLDRALFDEATYGRVRFHHRSIREFLTARWLLRLLDSGKARRAIESILFANRYGLDLVIPSMRPMAAWLALWDDRIRDRLLTIAPQVLIEYGDPARLPLPIRELLLKRFASLNESSDVTDASFDLGSVRRLATPLLANTVNELLDQYRSNEEVRQLLLRMIWQGEIAECAEGALSFATDLSMDQYTRICAMWAVGAARNQMLRRSLAEALLAHLESWDNQSVAEACSVLFPDILTLNELLRVIEATNPPGRFSMNPLAGVLEKIAKEPCPLSLALPLLRGLVTLLEREPHLEHRHYEISQRYGWLLAPAAELALNLIRDPATRLDESVLRTIELVSIGRRQRYGTGIDRTDQRLQDEIKELPVLRYALFWRDIAQRRAERAGNGERLRDWWPSHLSPASSLPIPDDFDYFVGQVREKSEIDDRLVALTVAFSLWKEAGRGRMGRERLWSAVLGEPELEAKLHALLHPGPMLADLRQLQRSNRDSERRMARLRAQEEVNRQAWIARLQADPDRLRHVDASTVDKVFRDLYYLDLEIARLAKSNFRWGTDRWELLIPEFGHLVAEAARDGLMAFWRLFEPDIDHGMLGRALLQLIAALLFLYPASFIS